MNGRSRAFAVAAGGVCAIALGIVTKQAAAKRLSSVLATLVGERFGRPQTKTQTSDNTSESDFRAMAELVPQIMWIASPEGAIEWYNSAWYAYTGQSPQEAAGWGWQGTHHPDDHASVMRIWPAALASGEPYEMEFRLKNTHGQYRWFLARGRPYRDASGKIVRWYGTNTDIDDQKRETERSQRIAMALQQVFLPDALPERDGLMFDAAYAPAGSEALVGGDWYDAVTLPDGRVLISIGDVGGHGLHAAVDAGRLRQIVLSEALNGSDAPTALSRADRFLRLQSEVIATALVAFYDPADGTLNYASAGHPTPVLAAPGQPAAFTPNGHGAPLGTGFVEGAQPSQCTVITLPAESLLVFYTDGITEIDRNVEAGERRLLDVAERRVDDPLLSAQSMLDDVLAGRTAMDDIAVLIMRRSATKTATMRKQSLTRAWSFHSSNARSASEMRASLMHYLREYALPDSDFFAPELVLGEVLANVVEHAPGLVEVFIDWSHDRPSVRVRDSGPGVVAGGATLPADAFSEHGRGLYLIETLATNVHINAAPGFGTEITFQLPLNR